MTDSQYVIETREGHSEPMDYGIALAEVRRMREQRIPSGLGRVVHLERGETIVTCCEAVIATERPHHCGHRYDDHGKHGCTRCHCAFVPIRELAR